MKRRPAILPILALAIGLTVLSIPVQIVLIYGHGWDEISEVVAKITALNWAVIAMGGFAAATLLRASPWARFAVPALIAMIAANNFVVGYYATDFSQCTTTMATLASALLNAPLLVPSVQRLLKNPELRWWMHAQRRRVALPVFVGGARDAVMRAQTYDLSETGAFIPLSMIQESRFETSTPGGGYLGLSEKVAICMNLGMYAQVRCEGRVVRRTSAKGDYPAGIGVEFVNMPFIQRRELKKYLARHSNNTEAHL